MAGPNLCAADTNAQCETKLVLTVVLGVLACTRARPVCVRVIVAQLWTWGRGDHGQHGVGHIKHVLVPTRVTHSSVTRDGGVADVACGDTHMVSVGRRRMYDREARG